jgi:hypothetical protein
MPDVHSNYLADLGALLLELAANARVAANEPDAGDYERGRLFAYYEVISLLLNQARAFQVSAADLGLDGFDAERELLISRGSKSK